MSPCFFDSGRSCVLHLFALFVVTFSASTVVTAGADSLERESAVFKIVDFDDDGTDDTLVVLREKLFRDSTTVASYAVPEKIYWGDDTPKTDDDRDTTEFSLPLGKHERSTIRIFDYNSDGLQDIFVTWNHADSAKKNKHREVVYLGGQKLRDAGTLRLTSVKAQLSSHDAVREINTTQRKEQAVGISNFYFREKPSAPAASKPSIDFKKIENDTVVSAWIRISPNPAVDRVVMTVVDDSKKIETIRLFSLDGDILLTSDFGGASSAVMSVESLATGSYSVMVLLDDSTVSYHKLLIQR